MPRQTRLRLVGRFQVVAIKDRNKQPAARKQPLVFDFAEHRVLVMHSASVEEANRIAEGLNIAGYETAVYDLRASRHL